MTHPKVFSPPSTVADALLAIESWVAVPTTMFLGETDAHWETLGEILRTAGVAGPRVHDARIVAICVQHGIDELWTADRDFSRFPMLATKNPLVGTAQS